MTDYVVRPGDTLSRIAARTGTTAASLASINNITNQNLIRPGQRLRLQATSASRAGSAVVPTTPLRGRLGRETSANLYVSMIRQHGNRQANDDLDAGLKVVVALRTSTNVRDNIGGRYDDVIAVVQQASGGVVHVRAFDGNTEPSGRYRYDGASANKGSSVDMNGDGRMDSGRLLAGTYRYGRKPGGFLGHPAFRATHVQRVERDTNQDGNFDAHDRNRIDERGASNTMYIHIGGNNSTGSAGCQTIRSRDYSSFLATIGQQAQFCYVLVNR